MFIFFKCANCKALYQLIKVEVGPESVDRQITCVLCGALSPAAKAVSFRSTFSCARQRAMAHERAEAHNVDVRRTRSEAGAPLTAA
jgi:hypothetical protein